MTLNIIKSSNIEDGTIVGIDVATDAITNVKVKSDAAIATSKFSGPVTSIASHGLGSVATLTAGTAAGNVVVLDGSGNLPAVSGVNLTGIVTDLTSIRQDILTLALHSAVADNKVSHNLPTAFIDQFEDDSGLLTQTTVDRNSTGEYVSSIDQKVIPAVVFDGTNDRLDIASGTLGQSNGKQFTVAFWMKAGSDSTPRRIFDTTNSRITVEHGGSNVIQVVTRNSSNAVILNISSVPTITVASGLTHVIVALNHATQVVKILINGAIVSHSTVTAMVDDTIALVDTTASVGDTPGANRTWTGELGQFYLTEEFIDFTVQANIDRFYSSSGVGVNLGADGSLGSGTQPLIFLNNTLSTWQNNLGSGGNFTEVGALTSGTDVTEAAFLNATGTLISNAQTAPAATTSLSGVILYTDTSGTATLGTDLKIYMSANNGTNFTEASSYATAQTFSGSVKIVRLGKTTVTSGTQIKLKAVWANQASGSKETRLNGWAINY